MHKKAPPLQSIFLIVIRKYKSDARLGGRIFASFRILRPPVLRFFEKNAPNLRFSKEKMEQVLLDKMHDLRYNYYVPSGNVPKPNF